MIYKRKEQKVKAIQYTGKNESEVIAFLTNTDIKVGGYESKRTFYYKDRESRLNEVATNKWYISVLTANHNRLEPSGGDWIVVDEIGGLYLYPDEVFVKTYDNTLENESLKPCPFCGGQPEIKEVGNAFSVFHTCRPMYGNDEDDVRMTIGSRLFGGMVQAVGYWNRRA